MVGTYIFIGFIVVITLALLGILVFASDEFLDRSGVKLPGRRERL
jgi:hypothetical protein